MKIEFYNLFLALAHLIKETCIHVYSLRFYKLSATRYAVRGMRFVELVTLTSLILFTNFSSYAAEYVEYYIQTGAYKSQPLAEKALKKIKLMNNNLTRIVNEQNKDVTFYKVQVGPFSSLSKAIEARQRLKKRVSTNYVRSYLYPSGKQRSQTPQFLSASQAVTQGVPLPPRVLFEATGGTNNFGQVDGMLPLFGNAEHIIFGDFTGKYGKSQAYLGSLGVGGRHIFNNAIVGAYFFGDYNRSPEAHLFPVINPGLEFMTNQWDAHVNGYLPVGKKNYLMEAFSGSQVGRPDIIFFREHTQYQGLYDFIEEVGPGADAELGYTFTSTNRTRVFGGGYYFSPQFSNAIQGVAGGFEVPVKKWASLEFQDTYDNNQHNTATITLRITLGGMDKTQTPTVQDRMLDRIPRHLGNLYNGDGIPSKNVVVNTGRFQVTRTNIWFFNPGLNSDITSVVDYNSCTFEHPCIGLSQTQIDAINTLATNANFYFSSGDYHNPAVGSGYSLYNGQSFFGRISGFTLAAAGADRPLLDDTLILLGNNTLSDLRVDGHTIETFDSGGGGSTSLQASIIALPSATGTVNILNSEVKSTSSSENVGGIINASHYVSMNINRTHSLVTLTTNLIPGLLSVNVGNINNGIINIEGSTVESIYADISGLPSFDLTFGVVNNSAGTININQSHISMQSKHEGLGLTSGILNNSTEGIGTVNVTQSTIDVTATSTILVGGTFNQGNNSANDSGTINIGQSTINVTLNDSPGGTANGSYNSGEGTTNLADVHLNMTGNDGNLIGLHNDHPLATINFQDTIIALYPSNTAIATPTQNVGTLNNNGGNQCFENGVSVPCT